jgi:hypothetical protein
MALVQTFPQQTTTVTMLQTRPSSASGAFNNQTPRGSGNSRASYAGGNILPYRGSTTPVAPYAFTTTPVFGTQNSVQNPLRQNPPAQRSDARSMSVPGDLSLFKGSASTQSTPSPKILEQSDSYFKVDSQRLSLVSPPLDLSLADPRIMGNNASKPSPDRYRRSHKRSETSSAALATQSAVPSGSGMAAIGHLYNMPSQSSSSPSFANTVIGTSKDDSAVSRSSDAAKRYRRRSIATYGSEETSITDVQPQQVAQLPARSYASVVSTPYAVPKPEIPAAKQNLRPASSHGRSGSDESLASSSKSTSTSVSNYHSYLKK